MRNQRGAIVNLTDVHATRPLHQHPAYSAAKAALEMTTRTLALELAPSYIRVNAVAPGCIDTDMVHSLGRETMDALAQDTPLGRLGTPEDIAAAVAFLAGEDASFITGQVLTADGGFIG